MRSATSPTKWSPAGGDASERCSGRRTGSCYIRPGAPIDSRHLQSSSRPRSKCKRGSGHRRLAGYPTDHPLGPASFPKASLWWTLLAPLPLAVYVVLFSLTGLHPDPPSLIGQPWHPLPRFWPPLPCFACRCLERIVVALVPIGKLVGDKARYPEDSAAEETILTAAPKRCESYTRTCSPTGMASCLKTAPSPTTAGGGRHLRRCRKPDRLGHLRGLARTSENSVSTKFAEFLFYALG